MGTMLVETVSYYMSIILPRYTCSMGTMLVETVSYYTMIYMFNGNHACWNCFLLYHDILVQWEPCLLKLCLVHCCIMIYLFSGNRACWNGLITRVLLYHGILVQWEPRLLKLRLIIQVLVYHGILVQWEPCLLKLCLFIRVLLYHGILVQCEPCYCTMSKLSHSITWGLFVNNNWSSTNCRVYRNI